MAEQLLSQLALLQANFSDVLALIDAHYTHRPTAFQNGTLFNQPEQNQGSAKVFSFAKLKGLDKTQTLHLFAEHYQAVLADPEGSDHQNIRQFMQHGWEGIHFEAEALAAK